MQKIDLENCDIAKPNKTIDSHDIRRKINGKSQCRNITSIDY